MAYVSFIDDNSFKSIVNGMLAVGRTAQAKTKKDFSRNVVDPFAIVFEMACFGMEFDDWYKAELARQSQKSLSNHLGTFHQKMLGAVDGWLDLGVGNIVDLENSKNKIIAEVKNKHNTLKASDQINLYKDLVSLVMPNGQKYKGYTSYYVVVNPEKPKSYDRPFTPSDRTTSTRAPVNELVRQIDGASFYRLVTGEKDALKMVFEALPKVIKDCDPALTMSTVAGAMAYFTAAHQAQV